MSKVYKQLSELGEIITGKTPSTVNNEYWNGDIPFITPTDINGFDTFYQASTERYVSLTGAAKQKKTLLPANSVCITCIGSTIGKPCVTKVQSITNQQINSIVPNSGNDFRYIYYLIRQNLSYLQLIGGGSGSGTPIISKNKFSKFKFLVEENLSIQRRIASILSAYDNLIENNTRRIRLLEQMAENLYKEWFVRFRFPGHEKVEFENGLPKGWKVEKIGDWGITLDTGNRPKGGIDDSLSEGIPSLGAEAIKDLASYDYSSTKYIPRDFYDRMKRGKNTGNDILLYKDGAYIGKVTLFRDGFPFTEYAINEHVFIISPNEKDYKIYLYFTLHQDAYFTLMQNLNRNAAQPGLSRPDIERVKMVFPSKDVISAFNKQVDPMLSNIFKMANENALLIKQRDLLLPRLMNGKLEVKE